MTGAELVGKGFTKPVAFRRADVTSAWRQALPKRSFGVFVVLRPIPEPLTRGESDVLYIGGAFGRGGVRGRLEEYLVENRFPKGSPGWKRAEAFCGCASECSVSYFPMEERKAAITYRDELVRQFEGQHGERPRGGPRRVVIPRVAPRRVLRVTPDVLVPPAQDYLVYVLRANRPIQYSNEKGVHESPIVYIGTSGKGVRRAAVSAVENAPRIFKAGAKFFDVVVISPPRLPDTEVEGDLERVLVRAFQIEFGRHVSEPHNGPLCNDHGPGTSNDEEIFRHFDKRAALKKIRELSESAV